MSKLGKRKDRDTQDEVHDKSHGSTIFVSNLPYTATSTDLKTLFSDLAPVRTAFVVLEHGTGASKGVGYVSFAIREDAAMAIDKIGQEGITLDGRNLRVEWAGSKNKEHEHGEEPKATVARERFSRHPKPVTQADPLAIRTVVVSGLPSGVDSKTLWKKVRKLQGAEKVEWPVKTEADIEDCSIAYAIFWTPAAASEAVNKLHAHVYKGSLLSATLKKRLDGLAKTTKSTAKSNGKQKQPNRSSRLIVRNLPFDITDQDIRAIFLPYGPIHSIDIPLANDDKFVKPDSVKKQESEPPKQRQLSKGFAFVWYFSRKDAEKAMESSNGMTVEAGIAETLVSDKQKTKKQRREEKKRKAREEGEAGEEDEERESDAEAEDGRSKRKRTIAVDWALSKDKWEAEKSKIEAQIDEEKDADMTDEDSGSREEDEKDTSSESDSDEEQLGVHEEGSDDSQSDMDDSDPGSGEDDDEDDEDHVQPTLPPPEVGTTIFVRNVPFEATEDELRLLFRAFGPLRYARITMDPATGRSRGTGFACFWNKEDADKAIEQSNALRAETMGSQPIVTKKNPFKLPSLLTPDPSASIAQNLVLHGRTLDVSRAVTRDEASKLKEAGERQREKADKRNLYLLREGIILPNMPAAASLPPAEVEKRTQSFNARRALLRTNPSLFVSRTRLSIRQLPLFVTERMLKRLAIHAVRSFEVEAKAGKREPLSKDELTEPAPPAEEDGEDVKMEDEGSRPSNKDKGKDKGRGKANGRNTGVKQAKIVRQQDRVDVVTGKGRSRGYGFLELGTHADALRVLRWANNNMSVTKLFEEWWKLELEELLAAEKKKKKETGKEKDNETRMKRIREEIERGVPPKTRGSLIVEFSIENVQVTQRRAGRLKEAKGGNEQKTVNAEKRLRRQRSLPIVKKEEDVVERPKKKRKMSELPQLGKGKETPSPVKPGKHVGGLIGRKRKEKMRKKTEGK